MLTTLEEIRDRLVERYQPETVILFGSRATGTALPGSDVDLLIVKETDKRPLDRQCEVEMILADRTLPVDVIVYTPAEMRYLYSVGSPFLDEVMEKGTVLYMRKVTGVWMADAEEELASSMVLLERGLLRPACYHGQQVVEKGLKALIIERGERPERTHDLVELLGHARQLGWNIALSVDDVVFLNSIYKGRYPTEQGLLPHGEPALADAERAVRAAKSFLGQIASLIPLDAGE